jgi:chaperonin GroES
LSSLAIIFPNADLVDQFDPLTNFHPPAIEPFGFDTPFGVVEATRLARIGVDTQQPVLNSCSKSVGAGLPIPGKINYRRDCNTLAEFTARFLMANWHSHLTSAKGTPIERAGRPHFILRSGSTEKLAASRRTDMKFRPLHDRVVVTRIDAQAKTAGGILIPDTVKEKPTEGEVIAVGPGSRDESGKLIPIDLKEGDKVLFGKWSGTEVKIDGVEYLIMKESDIMGVIEQTAARAKAA